MKREDDLGELDLIDGLLETDLVDATQPEAAVEVKEEQKEKDFKEEKEVKKSLLGPQMVLQDDPLQLSMNAAVITE